MIFLLVNLILGFSSQNYLLSQNESFLQKSKLVKDNKYFYDEIITQRYNDGSTTIGVYRCIFRSLGTETERGGAVSIILHRKCKEPCIFEDCIFENCIGDQGGALNLAGIKIDSVDYDLIINNCTFDSNRGTLNIGSAIVASNIDKIIIRNTKFFNNSMILHESSIFCGTVWISYAYKLNIDNCIFQGNSIQNNVFDYRNISFYGHMESTSIRVEGSDANITNTKFNCEFSNIYYKFNNLNITKYVEGGSIYSRFSNLTASNCSFTNISYQSNENCKCNIDFRGGVVKCDEKEICFINCSFEHYQFNSNAVILKSEIYGGIFYFNECNNITLSGCSFESNEISLNNRTFYENNIKNYGGVIYACMCKSTLLTNCTFMNNFIESKLNSVSNFGCCICLENVEANITDCTFSSNFLRGGSENFGGAIAIYYSDIDMYRIDFSSTINCILTNCIFDNNSASSSNIDSGGALYIMYGEVYNCTFVDNDAKFGGDLYFIQLNELDFTDFRYLDYMQSDLTVSGCFFKRTKNLNVKSIFFFKQNKTENLCKFENNKVLIIDPNGIKVFNGTFSNTKLLSFMFKNNSISYCNDQIFKDDNFNMYDSSDKNITFDDAFQECFTIPTEEITSIEIDEQTELITNDDYLYSKSKDISSSESNNEPIFTITEVISTTQSIDGENSYSNTFSQNTVKDKSSNKRNVIKQAVLILFLVVEVAVIALLVVLIIFAIKVTKHLNQDEPLLDN